MDTRIMTARIGLTLCSLTMAGFGCRFLLPTPEPTRSAPEPSIRITETSSPTLEPPTLTATPLPCDFTPSVEAYNLVPAGSSAACPDGGGYLYQSFLASSSEITSVSIQVRKGGSFPSNGFVSHVALRDCQIDGNILGEADAEIPGPTDVGAQANVLFNFSQPIPVTIGREIIIQWSSPLEGGKIVSWMFSDDTYPDGYTLGCNGRADMGKDYIFEIIPH